MRIQNGSLQEPSYGCLTLKKETHCLHHLTLCPMLKCSAVVKLKKRHYEECQPRYINLFTSEKCKHHTFKIMKLLLTFKNTLRYQN